jgi:mRNA-degrading endonuclease toxin of MazEF toxin-antitoxin module
MVLSVVGIGLIGGGLVSPAFDTLLIAWGGTALLGALLLVVFGTTRTVRADVATDVYATLADTCRTATGIDDAAYAPTDDGVRLGGTVPTGVALTDRIEAATVTDPEAPEEHLHVLSDGLVEELELAADARAEVGDGTGTVTVKGCRIGTDELFDHPVASVVGVGLARATGLAIAVEATPREDGLVVDCTWPAD